MLIHARWICLLTVSLLTACSAQQQAGDEALLVSLARGVHYQLQAPTAHSTQLEKVTGTYRGQTHVLLMQTESAPAHFALAGLSATGTRLFSLLFDGQSITTWKSPLFTAPFRSQFVLADYQLAHLPLAAAQAGLEPPAQLTETHTGTQRTRTVTDANGQAVIRIEYRADHTVYYCHLERDYCLLIEGLPSATQ